MTRLFSYYSRLPLALTEKNLKYQEFRKKREFRFPSDKESLFNYELTSRCFTGAAALP